MNVRKITEEIFYVGVNDRVKSLFEGLWPLPYGVSYNSYIVKGSNSTALIDTVQIDEVREFRNNIRQITGGKAPDYLVINHMEPDHSGSIPEVVKMYPEIKIVGNRQTISMVKDFYHLTDEALFITVADGDTLNLGDVTLKFYLTPMVHWPETMMTWVEEKKVLFSGDAFGTFGALNGGVTDEEMDTDMYIEEMYRYYSNIVAKYSKFVQGALKKLSDIEIDTICSTHGPVWKERVPEVIGVYSNLSSRRSEPGVTIIYGSMYGNTAEIAEIIARRLTERGVRRIKVHNASVSPMSMMISDACRYEGLIVGSATYSMRLLPPVEQFMNAMVTREVTGKVYACFGGYTWAKGAVVSALAEYGAQLGIEPVADMAMNRSAKETDLKNARELADKVADKLYGPLP